MLHFHYFSRVHKLWMFIKKIIHIFERYYDIFYQAVMLSQFNT